MFLLWPFVVLIISLLKEATGQSVNQKEGTVTVTEGNPISLDCSYQSSYGTNYLFWYIQHPGQSPRLLLKEFGNNNERLQGFQADHVKKEKTFNLTKSAIQLNDSAVYFCAVSDRGYNKLTFGQGTRLNIQPDLEDSPPSIYELRPDASAVGEKKDKAACLFTDYFPNSLKVKSKKGEKEMEANGSVVVVKEENAEKETGSYGIVLWGDKDDNFHCAASDKNGQKFVSNPADPGTCLAESGDNGSFETDFRLNLLSLTVLGLRVVFLKSVAFNLLLTFRLWSRRG